MRGTYLAVIGAALALGVSAPADARKQPPPAPLPPPAPVIPQVKSGDAGLDAFYYYDRAGAPLWLASDAGREAAAKVAEILARAPIDGLAEGPALSARVKMAIASGTLFDDAAISLAWLKYVRALKAPVSGVEYGDGTLMLKPPSAKDALGEALAAPSLVTHVTQVAAVNPFYATLREAALAGNAGGDPHVKGTLDRLRLIPAKGKIIIVDTGSQRLMMVEDGVVADSMKVVIGKVQSPTPLIAGMIHYVTLNPYWNIPSDVVQRKIAPLVIKRGVSYLKAARYEATDKWGVTAEVIDPASVDWKAVGKGEAMAYLRQLPGANNMMGAMKFGFANRFDIFLHDTPRRALFDKARRDLSMGCVRLERAGDLARWLLGSDAAPTGDTPEQQVKLPAGIPVYTLSLTANVDAGQIVYADDIYGYDRTGQAEALAASTVPVATAAEVDADVAGDGKDDSGTN